LEVGTIITIHATFEFWTGIGTRMPPKKEKAGVAKPSKMEKTGVAQKKARREMRVRRSTIGF
jgi:hypothetical protein